MLLAGLRVWSEHLAGASRQDGFHVSGDVGGYIFWIPLLSDKNCGHKCIT
jgi:hypothetical protein